MTTPKEIRQQSIDALMTKCRVFWAFSEKQLEEGKEKTSLQDGDKLVSIGAGGFMPKSEVDTFLQGMDEIQATFKQAMKDKKARRDHIAYELNNHEAYYTRNISSTLDALGEDFTREEVMEVFDGRLKTIKN